MPNPTQRILPTQLHAYGMAESNSNDLYRHVGNPSGTSQFSATIATLPGGTGLTFNIVTGLPFAVVPFSSTNLAKMRLYNSTRGNYGLINSGVAASSSLNLVEAVPVDWQVGDTITNASAVCDASPGIYFADIQIIAGPMDKSGLFVLAGASGGTVGDTLHLHPYRAFANSRDLFAPVLITTGITHRYTYLLEIINNLFCLGWGPNATMGNSIVREMGYLP